MPRFRRARRGNGRNPHFRGTCHGRVPTGFVNTTPFERSRSKAAALSRGNIWQGNCNATDHLLCSNAASFRNTKSIEYPLSNCPAKSGRLPSNVSIRSDPAIWTPRRAPASVRRLTPDRVLASGRIYCSTFHVVRNPGTSLLTRLDAVPTKSSCVVFLRRF